MRVLYFVGSLRAGGKERQLVELIAYLKEKSGYEIMLVTAFDGIEYPRFLALDVRHVCLHKRPKSKSPAIYSRLWRICDEFHPDLIHTWGSMQTFYMLPVARLKGIPLINGQIMDVFGENVSRLTRWMNRFNFHFSPVNLANSRAGLYAYGQGDSEKGRVIYNGIDMKRFEGLADVAEIKEKYGIRTKYAVIMVASYSQNKDYRRFARVATYVTSKRDDITFISAGAISCTRLYEELKSGGEGNNRIIFHGRTEEVENLVNACDIGMLLSTRGEGVSNSILEYMTLKKVVVVDEVGGTPEFVKEGENGFFTTGKSIEEVGDMIINLINSPEERERVGNNARETVLSTFLLEKMGQAHERLYREVISKKKIV